MGTCDLIWSWLGYALRGADRQTKPAVVGKGNIDWPALLARLDAAGYSGWVTIDPIDLPNPRAAAAAARKALL